MRKFLGYIVLVMCLLIYVVSSHRGLMRRLNIYKASSNGLFRSDRRYGDLYSMSYLPYFRKHYHQTGSIRTDSCGVGDKIHLYAVGDSYFWSFLESAKLFCGVGYLITAKINTREKLSVVLDTSKINILLFEISERNIWKILGDSLYTRDLVKPQQIGSKTTIDQNAPVQENQAKSGTGAQEQQASQAFNWQAKIKDIAFNKDINTNLESTLWDISWFTPVKELKAAINYNLLGVVDKGVYVSTVRRQLYYNETIDTSNYSSSFRPITDTQVDSFVNKLNGIYAQARNTGFQKAYFSIIPNPVSLLEPHFQGFVYNRLVERIQNAPGLKMPCINVLPVFDKLKDSVYESSDTHWAQFGAQIWLDQFNKELYKAAQEH